MDQLNNIWGIATATPERCYREVISTFEDGMPQATFKNRAMAISWAAWCSEMSSKGEFFRAVPMPTSSGYCPHLV